MTCGPSTLRAVSTCTYAGAWAMQLFSLLGSSLPKGTPTLAMPTCSRFEEVLRAFPSHVPYVAITILSSCSETRPVTSASLNQLVGAGEEPRWDSNAKCLGGFHIDDQLETSWLLDRQIGGLGAFEDLVDVHGSLAKKVRINRRVRHQPAFVDEPARHGNRRHAVLQRQLGGALARQAGLNDDGVGSVSLHRGESALELLIVANPDRVDCGSGGFAAKLDLFEERFGEGIGRVGQSGDPARRRQHVADQLDALTS